MCKRTVGTVVTRKSVARRCVLGPHPPRSCCTRRYSGIISLGVARNAASRPPGPFLRPPRSPCVHWPHSLALDVYHGHWASVPPPRPSSPVRSLHATSPPRLAPTLGWFPHAYRLPGVASPRHAPSARSCHTSHTARTHALARRTLPVRRPLRRGQLLSEYSGRSSVGVRPISACVSDASSSSVAYLRQGGVQDGWAWVWKGWWWWRGPGQQARGHPPAHPCP
jgi:hypothetical protein